MENYIDGIVEELPFATGDAVGTATDYAIGRNRYIGYLMPISVYNLDAIIIIRIMTG